MKIHSESKLTPEMKELLVDFIKFCKTKLEIEKYPTKICLFSKKHRDMTTGGYLHQSKEIVTLSGNRLFLDVLRSLAHELTHHKQNERGNLLELISKSETDINSCYENEAYERAGNLVKEWTRSKVQQCPHIYTIYFSTNNLQ